MNLLVESHRPLFPSDLPRHFDSPTSLASPSSKGTSSSVTPRSSTRRSRNRSSLWIELQLQYKDAVLMAGHGETIWAESEQLIERARIGLTEYAPELIDEGEGGTYILRDSDGEYLGVFKPSDEEPFSVGNPKTLLQGASSSNPEIKKGIKPGEGAVRELAAYLLDHGHKAGVPLTVLVEIAHPIFQTAGGIKFGSLQQFIPHECQSWDLGASQYDRRDVHNIGLLDIRLFNVDRHGGNILVRRRNSPASGGSKYHLVPIDHGFTLPDSVNGTDLWFEWLTWPQARDAFDLVTLEYIAGLDPEHDARILRALGLGENCVRTALLGTIMLQKGAARGLCLQELGGLLCRPNQERPSTLEYVLQHLLLTDSRSRHFLSNLRQSADEILDRPRRGTHKQRYVREPPGPPADRRRSGRALGKSGVGPPALRRTTSSLPFDASSPPGALEMLLRPQLPTASPSPSSSQLSLVSMPTLYQPTFLISPPVMADGDSPVFLMRRNLSQESISTPGFC